MRDRALQDMSRRAWKKEQLATRRGSVVEAIYPVIVSASRATDIPAFYSEWFLNRLRAGYAKWVSRFNARQVQHVAFRDCRVFVFWSKNPAPLLDGLAELDDRGLHYYFQFTLNDYEPEGLEPGVPPLAERIDTFVRLSEKVGPERVIWRFDPLLLVDQLGVSGLLDRIGRLADKLNGSTRKLVFSYADIAVYRSVQRNMQRSGVDYQDFTTGLMREMAEGLAALNKEWQLDLAACAEGLDLSDLGIRHNRCIDDELMIRLWPDDTELMRFLGHDPDSPADTQRPYLKDKGQRAECGCVVSKDIGRYRTCPHMCVYCYANSTSEEVRRNFRNHHPERECIC